MKRWLADYVRDLRAGGRVLCTREFWRAFYNYYKPESVLARTDLWVSRTRERQGREPDWDVERRIAKRRAENPQDPDGAK